MLVIGFSMLADKKKAAKCNNQPDGKLDSQSLRRCNSLPPQATTESRNLHASFLAIKAGSAPSQPRSVCAEFCYAQIRDAFHKVC
jgi:hypothetical protein